MPRPAKERQHLIDKYKELVWALSFQGYNNEEIGAIFNRHRSVVQRIVKEMPTDWIPKWVKKDK